MTYPAGVQLATLTFSNPLTFLGNAATRTEVTVQATAGVVWSATGEPIDDFAETVTPGAGMPGSLTAPFVDQTGFTDQAGSAFTMWAYIVTRKTIFGSAVKTVRKNWQPVLGQDVVDFDNLPGGSIGLPVSAPIVPVTSVAGVTGAVGAAPLADAISAYLPADASKLDASQKGAASGVAPLDSGLRVPEANLPAGLAAAALNATYAKRYALDAATDYGVSPTNTPAQNRAALQTAINDAQTLKRELKLPALKDGEYIDIDDTLLIAPSANLTVIRGVRGQTRLRSTVKPKPIFRVRSKTVLEYVDLGTTTGRDVSGFTSDANDVQFRGESLAIEHGGIKVEIGADGSRFHGITGGGFHCLFGTTAWDDALGAISTNLISDIQVDDVEGNDVAFVIGGRGVRDARYNNIRGTFSLSPGIGHPPHLVYLTYNANSRVSENVHLTGLQAWDSTTSAPVKLSGINGGLLSGLTARNTRGLIDIFTVNDFRVSNIISTADGNYSTGAGPLKASITIDVANRVTVDGFLVQFANIDHYRAVAIGGTAVECTVSNGKVVSNSTVANTNESFMDVVVYGTRNRVENVHITSIGQSRGSGFAALDATKPTFEDVKVDGNIRFGIVALGTTTGAVLNIDYSAIRVNAALAGAFPVFKTATAPWVVKSRPTFAASLDQPLGYNRAIDTIVDGDAFNYWASGQSATKSGTWLYSSGLFYNSTNNSRGGVWADFGTPNVEMETRVKFNGTRVGFMFRTISNNDTLLAYITATGAVIATVDANVGPTVLATSAAMTLQTDRYYNVKLIVFGSAAEMYVNGALALTYTLDGTATTKYGAITAHGIHAGTAQNSRFEWVRVRQG
jgi:hypothetical protein